MNEHPDLEEVDIARLKQLLFEKKYGPRPRRRQRLRAMGRLVEVPGLPAPDEQGASPVPGTALPPAVEQTQPAGRTEVADATADVSNGKRFIRIGRWLMGHSLLLFEVGIVVVFLLVVADLWSTAANLNREMVQIQRAGGQALALPTPTATPVIDVAILPGGHRPPVAGATPQPGEAGYIPAHLLPAINEYVPPPVPTPAPEQARRIEIAAIDVDSPIFQGMYDWEVLKKGVAQHIGSAAPGQKGNMVLAGHNDIYGEVFRDLDQLAPGDEIIVSSERRSYTYVVRETVIVEPTEVWVLAPTEYAGVTLISCYPYRVNTQRIVVFADLAA
jgi:sortase A